VFYLLIYTPVQGDAYLKRKTLFRVRARTHAHTYAYVLRINEKPYIFDNDDSNDKVLK